MNILLPNGTTYRVLDTARREADRLATPEDSDVAAGELSETVLVDISRAVGFVWDLGRIGAVLRNRALEASRAAVATLLDNDELDVSGGWDVR